MSIPVNTGNATGFADGTIFSTVPGDGGIVQVVQLPGTQPVSGTFWQATQPVSGPLTDAQLRALAVAVSGTFWQATQPVSIAATVTTDPSDRAARLLGHVTVDNASLAVTGTFWQATQPVSGTFWQATQPVSSTQLPAALAASGGLKIEGVAGGVSVPVSTGVVSVKLFDGPGFAVTQKAASTAAVAADLSLVVAMSPNSPLPAGTNALGSVTLATGGSTIGAVKVQDSAGNTMSATAKGTQGATGLAVQELRDAGRNARIFILDAITAAPVAEALASVVQWYGNAAVAATTTPAVVPAGKTLRLISWKIQYQSLATVGYAVVRLRVNTGGVAVLASPLAFTFEAGTNSGSATTAVTGAVTTNTGSFPEGFELPAGSGVGFSVAGYGPTGALTLEGGVRFTVSGYEY